MDTIPNTASDVKVFKARRSVERNVPEQVHKAVCLECPWKYTGNPGQRVEVAAVHGKDHRSTSGHRLEVRCVIELFVDTIPSRQECSR